MKGKIYDTIIVGSGPAGLTAAIYASRSGLSTLVVCGSQMGGQLMLTTDVEDFPGFPNGIQGPELIMLMKKQAERFGAEFTNGDVINVDISRKPFRVEVDSRTFFSNSLIIATGASAKWLGIPSEQKLIGKGVSSCAVCDGPFFRGKKIAVVGGGDAAMKEALFLSKFASEVLVIHRREALKAFPVLQDRARNTENIRFIFNSVVEEVLGTNKVEGVKIKDVRSGKIKRVKLDGLFVAVGHRPNTQFLKGKIDLDDKGYIKIKNGKSEAQFYTATSVDGVFAAGDVYDWHYQQAVTAAAAGCMAAMDTEEYLGSAKPQK